MDNIVKKLTTKLLINGCIKDRDYDICYYGIRMLFVCTFEIAAILLLSLMFGLFLNTVVFFLAFIPLRIYAGGYHADSEAKCFGVLIATYLVFVLIMKNLSLQYYPVSLVVTLIISWIVLSLYAPIKHENKKLSYKECKIYRKISSIIAFSEATFVFMMILHGRFNTFIQSFYLGFFAVFLSFVAGKIKNHIMEENRNEKV